MRLAISFAYTGSPPSCADHECKHDQRERRGRDHHERRTEDKCGRADRRFRGGGLLRDESVDELLELARFDEQRHILHPDLPVHLRQVKRLRLHELHEGAQVSAPRGHRRRELFLLIGRFGRARVLLQRVQLGVQRGEALVDVRAEFFTLFRGGRGEQHLLRAARAQHLAARFLGRAVRDVALFVDRLRRAVQSADLREPKHADRERADQQHREREPQRRLDG
jgi:hypothetical protein